jgi:hypothetical protein
LIANEDVDAVKAQVRGRRTRWKGTAHGRHYKAERVVGNTVQTAYMKRTLTTVRGLTYTRRHGSASHSRAGSRTF